MATNRTIPFGLETGVELSGTSSDRIQGFSKSFTSKERQGHKPEFVLILSAPVGILEDTNLFVWLKISRNLERIRNLSIYVTTALLGPVR